ncbi:MAG: alpha-L-glutamate ligase [Acidobacteria bacterium]|nr:alpha-L-glutamate ligase [Acidobacteriota bacterium]
MIVIISHPQDPHAGRVGDLLRGDGQPVLLLDLSDFPHRASLSVGYQDSHVERLDYAVEGAGVFDLTRARSVWWRRPQTPNLAAVTDSDVYAFTHNEWQEAINGLWQLIDAPWMNPPARDEVAGRKALQLKIASGLGLRIPRTLITSDTQAARAFIDQQGLGRTVFKTFSCTHAIWRETRLVGAEDLEKLEHVRLAPVIFQEYIEAAADLRVTVVGRKIFAAAIDARATDYPVDFRMSLGQARTEAAELPPAVSERLLALMDRLGLVYGAIDLRRTPEGEYVFLEINTAGEFLFIEERTSQPIARAVADWLADPSARA